jgi:hypothetical protein
VRADEAPLGGVERAGLLEDDVRNGQLADVVKLRREPQLLQLVELEQQPFADPNRKRGGLLYRGICGT